MAYNYQLYNGGHSHVGVAITAIHDVAVTDGTWTINNWDSTPNAMRLSISKGNLFLNIHQQSEGQVFWNGSTGYTPGASYVDQPNAGARSGYTAHPTAYDYHICVASFGDSIGVFVKRDGGSSYGWSMGICELEKLGTYSGGMCYFGSTAEGDYSSYGGFCTNVDNGQRGGVYAPSDGGTVNGWFCRESYNVATDGPIFSGTWHKYSFPVHKPSMSMIFLPIYVGKMNGPTFTTASVTPLGRIPNIFIINPGYVLRPGDTFDSSGGSYVVCSSGEDIQHPAESVTYPVNTLAVRYA